VVHFVQDQFAKFGDFYGVLVLKRKVYLSVSKVSAAELSDLAEVRMSQDSADLRPKERVKLQHFTQQIKAVRIADWKFLAQISRFARLEPTNVQFRLFVCQECHILFFGCADQVKYKL
jgi:hypothetical protein